MILSYLLQLVALWLLSMAMTKHFRHSFKRSLSARQEQCFSIGGWLTLVISFISLLSGEFPALMGVYWVSFLALNILLIALFNSWKSRKR